MPESRACPNIFGQSAAAGNPWIESGRSVLPVLVFALDKPGLPVVSLTGDFCGTSSSRAWRRVGFWWCLGLGESGGGLERSCCLKLQISSEDVVVVLFLWESWPTYTRDLEILLLGWLRRSGSTGVDPKFLLTALPSTNIV